jgi:hypothetical protein
VRAVSEKQAGRRLPALPSWTGHRFVAAAGVFRFLYFFPLEDDLDLDEEVEKERRR